MRTFAQKELKSQSSTTTKSSAANRTCVGKSISTNEILNLQRTMGNQAVLRMLQRHAEERNATLTGRASPQFGYNFSRIPVTPRTVDAIQTKLTIHKPSDGHEEEAERVSEQVMRMPEPQQQRARPCGGRCPKRREVQGANEHLQPKPIQAYGIGEAVSPIVQDVISSPGQPFDSETRAFFEPRFGHDFSQVRVHTNAQAKESARAINAAAYTVGLNIVFGADKSPRKDTLTAHELTHVVQQSNALNRSRAPIVQRDHTKESVRPSTAGQEQERDLRRRIIELAVQKTLEIGEALRNGYIWPEVETAPGATLTVEVVDQWTARNQTLQQLLLLLGDFIEVVGDDARWATFSRRGGNEGEAHFAGNSVVGPENFSSEDAVIDFYDNALWYVFTVQNVPRPRSIEGPIRPFHPGRFIECVLRESPIETTVLPPSLRTGQAPPTPSGSPQSQPRALTRATTQITDLWVEVPEPRAHPERVSGILTAFQAAFRPIDRPAPPRFELYIVGGTYLYNRGDRRIWLPNLPQRFPSLRQRQP